MSAHVDTFVRDHLPPPEDWPMLIFDGLDVAYPAQLNCISELLDRWVDAGLGDRPALRFQGKTISYARLLGTTSAIAHALVGDFGVVPGNRVLLRGFNGPTLFAAWLAVLKVGGVVVNTMPQLRARELAYIIEKARVGLALCDQRLLEEVRGAEARLAESPTAPRLRCVPFDALAVGSPYRFENVPTAADDPCLIAFTSGTTGQPKGAVHTHRDVLAICDTFSKHVLQPNSDDLFAGTPPLAFTYGLGGLLTFPMRVGASTRLLETPSPTSLLQLIQDERVSVLFTSPTMYRALLDLVSQFDISSVQKCVSAGEPLPLSTFNAWRTATGLRIIDGIGATEMLHIFISAAGDDIVPGSTGKVVPGYQARVTDDDGQPLPPGEIGKLAVRGPTGCRYLADPERQRAYVRHGWNYTGDAYTVDAQGYFWFQARADDMIISAGYNIAGPEVENVLLEHPKVKECGVVAAPDPQRGHIVKAYIVLRDPSEASPETIKELQEFVKSEIAPYKYPRLIEFVDALPRTETGKLQRYKLRQLAEPLATG